MANQPVVPPGAKAYTVFFRIDGGAAPTILDVTDDPKGAAPVRSPESVSAGGARSFWKTEWTVTAANRGARVTRVFLVTTGKLREMVSTVVAFGGADTNVSLVQPTLPVRLPETPTTNFQINAGAALTGVKIVASGLSDRKTGETIPALHLQIENASGAATPTEGLTIAPGASIHLRVLNTFKKSGQFSGPVRLRSNEKEDLGSIDIAVHSTSDEANREGHILLGLGIFTFFIVSVVAKSITRRQLLILPAARLRQEAMLLRASLEQAAETSEYAFPVLLGPDPNSLATMLTKLQVRELKNAGFLGFGVVIPFTIPDAPVANYQSFLASWTNRLAVQVVVIRTGVDSVISSWPDVIAANVVAAGQAALQTLDSLAVAGGTPELLRGQVQNALTTLRAAINIALARGGAVPASSTLIASPTPQQITVQIEAISVALWILWAVLTFVVGAAALIWFNDSFGTTQDLLQCFLWGVGVPAVAQGFGGLTSSSVSSALSMQVSR